VGNWGIVIAVTTEESPRAVVENVGIELTGAIVETEGGSVDTDDVSKASDYRQILESLGVEDEGCVVAGIARPLLGLDVETGINNLEGTDVSLIVGLVREGGINDNTIDMLSLGGGH